MRRKLLWVALFGTAIVVTGCGGGGGGGGLSATMGSATYRQVPYSTPVRVDSIKPIASTQPASVARVRK